MCPDQEASIWVTQFNHCAVFASWFQMKFCSDHVIHTASVHHVTECCPPAI